MCTIMLLKHLSQYHKNFINSHETVDLDRFTRKSDSCFCLYYRINIEY